MISKLFNFPAVYQGFHSLISGSKIDELNRHLSGIALDRPIRIIDLGCGPGTNAGLFVDKSRFTYLGVDINPKYIEQASDKYDLAFKCTDVTALEGEGGKFDIVLINSVMHHLSPNDAHSVLLSAKRLLDHNGECLVLDMVWPEKRGLGPALQNILIRLDRGRYCRTLTQLRDEIAAHLRIEYEKPFSICIFGIRLWNLWLLVAKKSNGKSTHKIGPPPGTASAGA